jgi:mercuric ion transport protein
MGEALKTKANRCFKTGLWGSVVVAICCFTPIFTFALALLGFAALTRNLDYILLPFFGIFMLLAFYGWAKTRWRKSPD